MRYPEEIITNIKKNNNLDLSNEQQLHKLLMMPEVRNAVEAQKFRSENFLIKYDTYNSVLSPLMAKRVIAQPILLEELQKLVTNNVQAWKEWDKLKNTIETIIQMPANKAKAKQTATQETYPQMVVFAANFTVLLTNPLIAEEYKLLGERLAPYLNAMVEPINDSAARYFKTLYEDLGRKVNEISFSQKKSGIQLGTVIHIQYQEKAKNSSDFEEPRQISYHVKTHQRDSTSPHSNTKAIDPKELFVYKILEYIGFGPKTHFFFNSLSPGGFFIATQNVEFTKNSKEKKKIFFTFDKTMDSCNADPESDQYEQARKNMIRFDLLSRFLRLQDTTTNPGNFGYVTINNEKTKWKLIDFRVPEEPGFYLNKEIFSDFKIGNGAFNYNYSKFLTYIFKSPQYEFHKMKIAHQLMIELREGRPCQSPPGKKMSLQTAIEKTRSEIVSYVKTNQESLQLDAKSALDDLECYIQAIQANFHLLHEGISKDYEVLLKDTKNRIAESNLFKSSPDLKQDKEQTIVSLVSDYL